MSSDNFEDIVSRIVCDTPNGEISEVYNDLLAIAGEQAKESVLEAIEKYNVANNVPVDVEGTSVILSRYNKEGSKYFDPVSRKLFSVNHLDRKAFDIEAYDGETKLQEEQSQLLEQLKEYANDNFSGDVASAVYPIPQEKTKVAIIVVSTRYNPSNYWNGQWRSEYIYDYQTNELMGKIEVRVHYYEDGNVNFTSKEELDNVEAEDPIVAIQDFEKQFEGGLDTSFNDLNEKKFKALRRRLPINKSKVNWGKAIGNYRLGRDAAQGSQ